MKSVYYTVATILLLSVTLGAQTPRDTGPYPSAPRYRYPPIDRTIGQILIYIDNQNQANGTSPRDYPPPHAGLPPIISFPYRLVAQTQPVTQDALTHATKAKDEPPKVGESVARRSSLGWLWTQLESKDGKHYDLFELAGSYTTAPVVNENNFPALVLLCLDKKVVSLNLRTLVYGEPSIAPTIDLASRIDDRMAHNKAKVSIAAQNDYSAGISTTPGQLYYLTDVSALQKYLVNSYTAMLEYHEQVGPRERSSVVAKFQKADLLPSIRTACGLR